MARAERTAAYRCDIVYLTAKEVAFDYLRDHLASSGVRDPRLLWAQAVDDEAPVGPTLPGLCLALVDEADSILLDEACTPLILSAPAGTVDEAGYRRAFFSKGEVFEMRLPSRGYYRELQPPIPVVYPGADRDARDLTPPRLGWWRCRPPALP